MKATLTDEQRRALDQQPEGIEIEDPLTQNVYILTNAELHRRALLALQRQQDREAIQTGIEEMQEGQVVPFEEVDRRIRERLNIPQRES